jgi:hypothetical protein
MSEMEPIYKTMVWSNFAPTDMLCQQSKKKSMQNEISDEH